MFIKGNVRGKGSTEQGGAVHQESQYTEFIFVLFLVALSTLVLLTGIFYSFSSRQGLATGAPVYVLEGTLSLGQQPLVKFDPLGREYHFTLGYLSPENGEGRIARIQVNTLVTDPLSVGSSQNLETGMMQVLSIDGNALSFKFSADSLVLPTQSTAIVEGWLLPGETASHPGFTVTLDEATASTATFTINGNRFIVKSGEGVLVGPDQYFEVHIYPTRSDNPVRYALQRRWYAGSCVGIDAGETALTTQDGKVCCRGELVVVPDCSLNTYVAMEPMACGDWAIACQDRKLVVYYDPEHRGGGSGGGGHP